MSDPIVVVGDVLLDVDVETTSERLVPDAPAPVLDEVARKHRPGGAALAATLAAREAGRQVVLVAPLADDEAGAQLRDLLPTDVDTVGIPCSGSTPVKTRLRARGHTVARLDRGGGERRIGAVPAAVRDILGAAAAVLVSDYGAGATRHESLRQLLVERAAQGSMVWDPHPRGGPPVAGATLVTPNAAEATAAARDIGGSAIAGDGIAAIRQRAELLLAQWQARSVAVTLANRGALLSYGNGTSEIFPAAPAPAGDPCGAGDCFAAAATSALARRALPSAAVGFAVAAASQFVAAGGASGLTHRDDADDTGGAPASAAQLVAAVRAQGGTVVATGGCFDLLHAGHIATLAAARSLGDCLIVCLNSDESVRRLKGPSRPLQPEADRVRVLMSLRDVDAVVVFGEDTPEATLRRLRPDIWVKGGDYAGATLPEAALLRQWGGEVVTVPYLSGRSTSELVGLARR